MTRRIGTLLATLALFSAGATAIESCASVMTAWQDASNRNMLHRIAPALTGVEWIHDDQEGSPPQYDGHWSLLVFFDPEASATPEQFPALREARERYRDDGLVVLGITEADLEKATFFLEDHPLNFSVVANAREDRIAFGIKNLYKPKVYLVDPYQRILAQGLTSSLEMLEENYGH